MLEVIGWEKHAEVDNFNDGCTGESSCFGGTDRFTGNTIEALIDNLQAMFWCEYVSIGVCEEPNRIEMMRMENADGDRAFDLDKWKAGEEKLWYCTYTFYVDETTRKPAELEEKEYELQT